MACAPHLVAQLRLQPLHLARTPLLRTRGRLGVLGRAASRLIQRAHLLRLPCRATRDGGARLAFDRRGVARHGGLERARRR
eukprot:5850989-Prymnesium_polylepis.1